jgi:hypothetical protein
LGEGGVHPRRPGGVEIAQSGGEHRGGHTGQGGQGDDAAPSSLLGVKIRETERENDQY